MRKTIYFLLFFHILAYTHNEGGVLDVSIEEIRIYEKEKYNTDFFPVINMWEKTQNYKQHAFSPNRKLDPERVSDVVAYDDVLLAAMLLNTECAGCSYNEKLTIIEVLAYRSQYCYRDWGGIREQIFAPAQFSGVTNGNDCKYFIDGSNNPTVSNRFYFDPENKYHLENWNAAYEILILGRRYWRCDMTRFAVISKSTDRKQAAKVKATEIETPSFFEHTFSFNKVFSWCENSKTKIASML